MWKPLSILAIVLALAGCASSQFSSSAGGGARPWRGKVEVLHYFPPAGTFERIGVVLVRGVGLTSDSEMFQTLKTQAARRGANAVVLQNRKILDGPDGHGGTERRLAGFAIRLKKP